MGSQFLSQSGPPGRFLNSASISHFQKPGIPRAGIGRSNTATTEAQAAKRRAQRTGRGLTRAFWHHWVLGFDAQRRGANRKAPPSWIGAYQSAFEQGWDIAAGKRLPSGRITKKTSKSKVLHLNRWLTTFTTLHQTDLSAKFPSKSTHSSLSFVSPNLLMLMAM